MKLRELYRWFLKHRLSYKALSLRDRSFINLKNSLVSNFVTFWRSDRILSQRQGRALLWGYLTLIQSQGRTFLGGNRSLIQSKGDSLACDIWLWPHFDGVLHRHPSGTLLVSCIQIKTLIIDPRDLHLFLILFMMFL